MRPARGRNRSVFSLLAGVTVALLVSFQLTRPASAPAMSVVMSSTMKVQGPAAHFPWPASGEAAVAAEGLGTVVSSGHQIPVPIASLTKMMTAYIVLRDHPLSPGAQGADLVMSTADQAEAGAEAAANDSSVPVEAGEVLSERQLLDGLLVHSADNFADVLAQWDAGSVAAFVDKMNATAASLQMGSTHYADTSGLDPADVSTASDQLRLALRAMQVPTFAAVVRQPTVTLPIAGKLSNYVQQVGTGGIVGVKSGFTQAAMGCLVLAADSEVDGRSVEVLAAVLHQPGFDPLAAAAKATIPLLDATASTLRFVRVVPAGRPLVEVSTDWSSKTVGGVASSSVYFWALPGETVHREVHLEHVKTGAPARSVLGTVAISLGDEREIVRVRSTAEVRGPSIGWRLERF